MRQLARRLAIELGFQPANWSATLGDLLWWLAEGEVSDGAVRQASGARAFSSSAEADIDNRRDEPS